MQPRLTHNRRGLTLIEIVGALAIASLLMLSLTTVVMNALAANDDARVRNELNRDARFVMQRIVQAVQTTDRLFIPQVEVTATAYSESVRDPGVLAVALATTLDRDDDGFADADNDNDGRVNEDPSDDLTEDSKPGIIGIDDDNDGGIDEGNNDDDDEDGASNEDPWNGLDDDGDGQIDEDPDKDVSDDGAAGVIGVDDDNDGDIDEGHNDDDDEDGWEDEDWIDTVVYFLTGTVLVERHPNFNPTSGADFTERVLTDNVTQFRVERLPRGSNRYDLVEISLTLSDASTTVTVQQKIRVGTAQ